MGPVESAVMKRGDSSERSAARFFAARASTSSRMRRASSAPRPPPPEVPRRIEIDFAEPTLRVVHEILCDAIAWNGIGGDKLNRLLIAEQMVAVALGEPACDDPPLTDRNHR